MHTEFLLENLEEGNVDRMMMIIMVVVMLMTTEWTLRNRVGKCGMDSSISGQQPVLDIYQ